MSLLSPQLEAFIAIVKHKTVHGAAENICLTQTAVTQRIRALERMLKTTLFVRTRRGMNLTHEGKALYRYCIAAKELEGETLANIHGYDAMTNIELTIGASTSIMRSRVLPSCIPILKQFAHLYLHFISDDYEDKHQKLRSGTYDLAIIKEEQLSKEMRHKKLAEEQYVLVGSAKWKGRHLNQILEQEKIVDFNEQDEVTFNYLKKYQLFERANKNRYYANRTDNLAYLIASGVGYSTLAKEFAKPYVDSKEIIILNKGQVLNINPVLAWFDRPEPPAYFSAILNAIS